MNEHIRTGEDALCPVFGEIQPILTARMDADDHEPMVGCHALVSRAGAGVYAGASWRSCSHGCCAAQSMVFAHKHRHHGKRMVQMILNAMLRFCAISRSELTYISLSGSYVH